MTTEKAKRGRPASKDRAPDGMPAKVRILWENSGKTYPGPQCEQFSSAEAALRLIAAWGRYGVVPVTIMLQRKGAAGWVDL
jgi:hypothetical protein